VKNIYSANQFEIRDRYYGDNQEFGGQYVPEILLPSLDELESAFQKYRNEADFLAELKNLQQNFIGRPSPLIFAKRLTDKLAGAKIYLKNEGNNLTGSHKINHCIYQALLAKRMGKKRVICETGAGQHGIAVATVCAKFGFDCVVYMGQKDIEKQYPNVFFMKQMGAEIVPVLKGKQRLVEAVDAALGDFLKNPDSYYMLGSALGPHPYPEIMREAQRIVSVETKQQLQEIEGRLPDLVIACIGGGSNAIGAFNEYLYDEQVRLIGVEAGGEGIDREGQHASRISSGQGRIGVMEGFKSYFLLDENGQCLPTETISAGLNYAGIGPLHAYMYSVGRIEINSVTDTEVLKAFKLLAETEGLISALESAHAVAKAVEVAPQLGKDKIVLVNLSGRGDNYLFNIAKGLEDQEFKEFCKEFSKPLFDSEIIASKQEKVATDSQSKPIEKLQKEIGISNV
jgi:tryptophan synthase beta chain